MAGMARWAGMPGFMRPVIMKLPWPFWSGVRCSHMLKGAQKSVPIPGAMRPLYDAGAIPTTVYGRPLRRT